jgi:hypothetical protein
VRRIWEQQSKVAAEVCQWNVGDEESLQTIRDRARRLQVIEVERKWLKEVLCEAVSAYERFVKELSFIEKAGCAFFFVVRGIFGERSLQRKIAERLVLPLLPISMADFSQRNQIALYTSNEVINRKGIVYKFPIVMSAKVLQEIDDPLVCRGKTFATRISVLDTRDQRAATIDIVRHRDCLSAAVSGNFRVSLMAAKVILLHDWASSMYIYGKTPYRTYQIEKLLSPDGIMLRTVDENFSASISQALSNSYCYGSQELPLGSEVSPERMSVFFKEENGKCFASVC